MARPCFGIVLSAAMKPVLSPQKSVLKSQSSAPSYRHSVICTQLSASNRERSSTTPTRLILDPPRDYWLVAIKTSKITLLWRWGVAGGGALPFHRDFWHWSSTRVLKADSPGEWPAYLHLKQVRNSLRACWNTVLTSLVWTGHPPDVPLDGVFLSSSSCLCSLGDWSQSLLKFLRSLRCIAEAP